MQVRPRLLSVFASAMALSVCAIAAAESPAAAAPGAAAPGVAAPGVVAPAAPPTTAAVSAPASPAANKIWECTTKGVRTFSSNPCGTNPTVRELNPVNVMEPAPMYRVTHTYAPPPSDYVYSSQAASDATSDNAYNAYPGYVVVTRSHRARPTAGRSHPPHPHH